MVAVLQPVKQSQRNSILDVSTLIKITTTLLVDRVFVNCFLIERIVRETLDELF